MDPPPDDPPAGCGATAFHLRQRQRTLPHRSAEKQGIKALRRLTLTASDGTPCPDCCVAVEVTLLDNRQHLLIARDSEDPLHRVPTGPLTQPELGVTTEEAFTMITR